MSFLFYARVTLNICEGLQLGRRGESSALMTVIRGGGIAIVWADTDYCECQSGFSQKSMFQHAARQSLCMTRSSSGDEIANVNFLYDDIVHALPNTMDSCINSTHCVGSQVYQI